jgi:hypothetical protein
MVAPWPSAVQPVMTTTSPMRISPTMATTLMIANQKLELAEEPH